MTTDTLARDLAAALGPDTLVQDSEVPASARAPAGWCVVLLGFAVHVLRDGDTVAIVDLEDLTCSLSLSGVYEGTELFPVAESQRIVEEEIWPAWEARGYQVDHTCKPDNGWDADERLWILNVKRTMADLASLAAELKWIAAQERIQRWS